jgi:hypothetical protein
MCIQHSGGATAQALLQSVFVDTEMLDDVDCMQLDGRRQKLMEEIKWKARQPLDEPRLLCTLKSQIQNDARQY